MTAISDFYYTPVSGPCQAVLMTAKALGVTLNRKLLDMKAGEHLKPEFLKLNQQHIVPTLVDNGFVLWESRAIMAYLVERYGKSDALYPKCPQKRAQINQRLYFDMSMQANFREYYFPIFMKQKPNPELFKKVQAAFELLNTFLEGTTYAVGDNMTLADISFVATVSTFDVSGFEVNKYPNVEKWYKKCQATMPGWEENWEGCLERSAYFK